jgi:hypothetical protein
MSYHVVKETRNALLYEYCSTLHDYIQGGQVGS